MEKPVKLDLLVGRDSFQLGQALSTVKFVHNFLIVASFIFIPLNALVAYKIFLEYGFTFNSVFDASGSIIMVAMNLSYIYMAYRIKIAIKASSLMEII